MESELISPDDVDDILNLPIGRAKRLAKKGQLPAVILADGTVRFRKRDIEAIVKGEAVPSAAVNTAARRAQEGDKMFKDLTRECIQCADEERLGRRGSTPRSPIMGRDRLVVGNRLMRQISAKLLAGIPEYRDCVPSEFRGIGACDFEEAIRAIDYLVRGYRRETNSWGRASWVAYGISDEFAQLTASLSIRGGGNAGISTGAVANLVANTMFRIVVGTYNGAVQTWRSFCNPREVTDFKAADRILIDAGTMPKVDENGEVHELQLVDAKETIQAELHASLARISLQALTSDHTDTLRTIGTRIGRTADATIAKKVFQILLSNPVMKADGNALFHALHGNLDTTASALSQTNLATAVKNFKKQTRIQPNADASTATSGDPTSIYPKFLLVPPELDISARAIVRNIETDNSPGNLIVLSEERLSDSNYVGSSATAYYLFADPHDADTIEVAYLKGMKVPQIAVKPDQRILGLTVRVAHAFGVAPIDWRAMHKSNGA